MMHGQKNIKLRHSTSDHKASKTENSCSIHNTQADTKEIYSVIREYN